MQWNWTGFRIDSNGNRKRTGFELIISKNIRISSFSLPGKKVFEKRDIRVVVEFWKLHLLATWRSDQ